MRWTEYAGTLLLYEDMVQYEYAKDENGRLVHYLEAKKGFRYFCVECGGEMIKCKGERLEYFRHLNMDDKEVTRTHNHDTYLHNLAELYFSERCKEGKLMVRLTRKNHCFGCLFNEGTQNVYPFCNKEQHKEFNIMEICDYVGVEKAINVNNNKYVADILLKAKDDVPVLIEIWYTHKCEDQKMKDCRVFEVKIDSEEDLVSAVPEMIVDKDIFENKDMVKMDNIATMCRDFYDHIKDDNNFRRWKRDLMTVRIGNPDKNKLYEVCLDCDYSYITQKDICCSSRNWDCPVKKLRFSPYYPKPGNYTIL